MKAVNEKFTFTPSTAECLEGLRAITRSINGDTVNPVVRLLVCLAIYGLPLVFAGVLFPRAFDEIYLTFVLFIVAAVVLPRMVRGAPAAIAERYSVNMEVSMGPENIRQSTPTADTSWSWASLNRLHVLNKLVVLEFRDWSWIPLPNHLWADDGAKDAFLGEVRERAPGLLPEESANVPNPFTLINIGAGFGAIDIYLLLMTVLARTARSECGCNVAWHIAGQPVPFWLLNATAIALSFAAFFPILLALRALNRRRHLAAVVTANLLIWPVPIALIVFEVLR